MVGSKIDNSCKLVYTSNRIGKPNDDCLTGADRYGTGAFRNKVKFENNGCRKVDRTNTCNQKLYRG